MEDFVSWRAGKTWFTVQDDLNQGIPIIVINGGPGSSSDYCKPFDDLAVDRAVIRYDQLDTGRSDRPGDTANWTFESYIEELEALIAHLGIKKYHLLGHSWGAMLALEYLKTERPQIASLILASCMWDILAYNDIACTLLKDISPIARIRATQLENAGKIASVEYQSLNNEWTKRHIYRGGDVPAWTASPDGYNYELYNYMWGPSEFTVNGTMKDWSAREWMSKIDVPTLIICGEYDEATPDHAHMAAEIMPNSTVAIIENASHFFHIEQPDMTLRTITEHLIKF